MDELSSSSSSSDSDSVPIQSVEELSSVFTSLEIIIERTGAEIMARPGEARAHLAHIAAIRSLMQKLAQQQQQQQQGTDVDFGSESDTQKIGDLAGRLREARVQFADKMPLDLTQWKSWLSDEMQFFETEIPENTGDDENAAAFFEESIARRRSEIMLINSIFDRALRELPVAPVWTLRCEWARVEFESGVSEAAAISNALHFGENVEVSDVDAQDSESAAATAAQLADSLRQGVFGPATLVAALDVARGSSVWREFAAFEMTVFSQIHRRSLVVSDPAGSSGALCAAAEVVRQVFFRWLSTPLADHATARQEYDSAEAALQRFGVPPPTESFSSALARVAGVALEMLDERRLLEARVAAPSLTATSVSGDHDDSSAFVDKDSAVDAWQAYVAFEDEQLRSAKGAALNPAAARVVSVFERAVEAVPSRADLWVLFADFIEGRIAKTRKRRQLSSFSGEENGGRDGTTVYDSNGHATVSAGSLNFTEHKDRILVCGFSNPRFGSLSSQQHEIFARSVRACAWAADQLWIPYMRCSERTFPWVPTIVVSDDVDTDGNLNKITIIPPAIDAIVDDAVASPLVGGTAVYVNVQLAALQAADRAMRRALWTTTTDKRTSNFALSLFKRMNTCVRETVKWVKTYCCSGFSEAATAQAVLPINFWWAQTALYHAKRSSEVEDLREFRESAVAIGRTASADIVKSKLGVEPGQAAGVWQALVLYELNAFCPRNQGASSFEDCIKRAREVWKEAFSHVCNARGRKLRLTLAHDSNSIFSGWLDFEKEYGQAEDVSLVEFRWREHFREQQANEPGGRAIPTSAHIRVTQTSDARLGERKRTHASREEDLQSNSPALFDREPKRARQIQMPAAEAVGRGKRPRQTHEVRNEGEIGRESKRARPAHRLEIKEAESDASADTEVGTPAQRLMVTNLSFTLDEDAVRSVVAGGENGLGDVRIVRDPTTQRSKGFGFLSFGSIDAATAALTRFQGIEVDGRAWKIVFATERSTLSQTVFVKGISPEGPEPTDAEFKDWVVSAVASASQDRFDEALVRHSIDNIRLVRDRESGQLRGFAYIEFSDANLAVAAATALDGHAGPGDSSQPPVSAALSRTSRNREDFQSRRGTPLLGGGRRGGRGRGRGHGSSSAVSNLFLKPRPLR